MYSDLIIPDINALEKSKGKTKDKTENISNVLKSLESVFTAFFCTVTMRLNQNQRKALWKEQN